MESELCTLLQNLLEVDSRVAAAIFYQISNTRSRYAIISRLIALKPEPHWKAWTKIESWLGPCDTARNHLIHWFEGHEVRIFVKPGTKMEIQGMEQVPLLRNAARKGSVSSGEKRYRTKDILEERDKFRVMLHIVNRFELTVRDPEQWPWTDIFQQPAACQTPVEFLLRLNERGHVARLPPYAQ